MRFDLILFLIGFSLILVELAVPGLYIAAFGIGSLVAAAFAYMGYPAIDLLIVFIVSTSGAAIISRRFYSNFFPGPPNPNGIVGKKGKVIGKKDGALTVEVGRQKFLAKGNGKKGEKVKVTGKDDTFLLVEQL